MSASELERVLWSRGHTALRDCRFLLDEGCDADIEAAIEEAMYYRRLAKQARALRQENEWLRSEIQRVGYGMRVMIVERGE